MPEENPVQEIVDDLLEDIAELRQAGKKSKVPPFGMVRLYKGESRKRVQRMASPAFMALIDRVGLDAAMEMRFGR